MNHRNRNHPRKTDTAMLRAAAGVLSVTLAAMAPLAGAHATTIGKLPAPQEQHGVHYVTGGVAADEAAAFRHEMKDYPLAIQLLEKQKGSRHDEYTSDARVRITRPGGKEVLDAKAGGPYMLVKLDPGTYEVSASLGHHTLHKRHVTIAHGRTVHETFVFPSGTA